MATVLLDVIHPGEILLEEFLKPMEITATKLAADIDVPPSRISDIIHGRRPITVDTAVRLGLFFSMDPRFWTNLQSEHDLRVANQNIETVKKRVRVFEHPMAA